MYVDLKRIARDLEDFCVGTRRLVNWYKHWDVRCTSKDINDSFNSVLSSRQDASYVYHLYVKRTPKRDVLKQYLKDKGISALVHYPVPVHLQPDSRGRLKSSDTLLETELAATEVLSLPIYPELNKTDIQVAIEAVKTFV